VIECIFGVVKQRFRLMVAAPEFSLHAQAQFVPAINFIRIHDPDDMRDDAWSDVERQSPPILPEHLGGNISRVEQEWASARRDEIVEAMWAQYVEYQSRIGDQGE
jgi:hypothetical protein